MKPETIRKTVQAWQADPAKAFGQPMVTARSEGAQAVLAAGTFTWSVDLPPALGGANGHPSPTAYLLGALAGCAVVFIRDTLAPQLGIAVDAIEAVAQCQADNRGLLGMDGVSPELSGFDLTIRIQTGAPGEQVDELYQTWRERCPIFLALLKPLEVRTAMEVRQP